MARGFSKAIITGNVTRDPEMRTTPSGVSVCGFTVAVNRTFKDSSGNSQEQVSFIDCTAWGRAGEIIAQYGKKGAGILVSGRLEQRSWNDKETGQKRSRVEIIVEDFNFLGGGQGNNNNNSSEYSANSSDFAKTDTPKTDDAPVEDLEGEIDLSEIPF